MAAYELTLRNGKGEIRGTGDTPVTPSRRAQTVLRKP